MRVESLLNTQSTNIEDYEEFFEKYLDYRFVDFIGDRYHCRPVSLLVSYSEYQTEGAVTFKYKSGGKTMIGSSESITMVFKKDKWLGDA